ncbi:MAG: hypothetical protein WDZ30_01355 [Cellvibrionaceae bacterium]
MEISSDQDRGNGLNFNLATDQAHCLSLAQEETGIEGDYLPRSGSNRSPDRIETRRLEA